MYCGGGATGGDYGGGITLPNPMPQPDEDCTDCVRTVTTYKTVQVPCTRNVTKHFTVKVPKNVPYTAYRNVTKFRNVTKQVPKTIYVNVHEKQPYTVQEPYTGHKTVYINESRTSCHPVTKMITRRVPVVNVVPTNPPPCPPPHHGGHHGGHGHHGAPVGIPVAPGGAFAQKGTLVGKDANYDGVIAPNEMGFVPDKDHHHGGHHGHHHGSGGYGGNDGGYGGNVDDGYGKPEPKY